MKTNNSRWLLLLAGIVSLPASAQAQLGPYALERLTAQERQWNDRVANASGIPTGPYSLERITAQQRQWNDRAANASGIPTGPYSLERITAPRRVYAARVYNAGHCGVPVYLPYGAPIFLPRPVAWCPPRLVAIRPYCAPRKAVAVRVVTGGVAVGFSAYGD